VILLKSNLKLYYVIAFTLLDFFPRLFSHIKGILKLYEILMVGKILENSIEFIFAYIGERICY
jgi:ABC-type maltose transport system permease subunit